MSNDFVLRKAERKRVKLRVGISSPSGGGKTYSALLMAYGMTGDWSKIAVIDTEQESASLYSSLGDFQILSLTEPYTPERYIKAIETCEGAPVDVIIIDSVSHEWDGPGGCLEIHSLMQGNSYTNWREVTPRHKKFIDKINQCKKHVITTARRKTDYVIEQNDKGKAVPIKAGMKEIQREGFEYELTLNFGLEVPSHMARAEKDRTGLFMNRPAFLIKSDTGKELIEWANIGEDEEYSETKQQKIMLAGYANELKITDPEELREISAACKGVPMSALKERVTSYINNPLEG